MGCVRAPVSKGRCLRACLIVFCLTSTPAIWGQQAAQKPSPPGPTEGIGRARLADNPVEVLGGHLTVRMPQGARVEARPFPIMGAPESLDHETRVVFDASPERLVLLADESFAFAGDDFEQDVKEWVAQWRGKYKIEPCRLPVKALKAVAVIPVSDPDRSRSDDATFVEGLFVESGDRTIQSLDVYVNAAAEKDLKQCKAVAHQILLSVAPGKKKLDLVAGERRLSANSADLEIAVRVPKDTVATTQVGADFLVHRLIALGRLGSDSGSILVYVGGAPDYQAGPRKGEGMLLGKRVEWHTLPGGQGLQTLCELPIPGGHHVYAHIIIQASNDAQLRALRETAGSMKLVKTNRSPPK